MTYLAIISYLRHTPRGAASRDAADSPANSITRKESSKEADAFTRRTPQVHTEGPSSCSRRKDVSSRVSGAYDPGPIEGYLNTSPKREVRRFCRLAAERQPSLRR